MKDAKGHGSDARGGSVSAEPAHQEKVNQIGQESSQSRDLRLFADNDRDLNRQSMQPIRDNLGRKMDKGTYDPQKAEKLWGYHADRAAQAYHKQFGSAGQQWHQAFPTSVRREAAAHWQRDEAGDIKIGSSRTYKG